METTTNIQEILTSQRIVKGANQDIQFPAPDELLNPILEIFSKFIEPNEITGFATHPESIGTKDDEILTAYGRAGVIQKIVIDEKLTYNVGYLYALDLGKPVLKIFSGINVNICSNMCIFNATNFDKYELMSVGKSGAIEKIKNFMERRNEDCQKALQIVNVLKNLQFNEEETQKLLGDFLISFQVVKNYAGVNCITNAAKLLKTKGGIYYYEGVTSGWNIYNAITHYFGEKSHIIDHPEKVFFVYEKFIEHCKNNNQIFKIENAIFTKEIEMLN